MNDEQLPLEPDEPKDVQTARIEKRRTIRDDDEIMRLLDEAEASSQREMHLPLPPEPRKERKVEVFPVDTQSPKRSHDLYYKRLERMRKAYLKGLPRKMQRIVRDEITLFINEGEITGRDSRQGYFWHLETAIATIEQWYSHTLGANISLLYKAFNDLNRQRVTQGASKQNDDGEVSDA